MSSQPVKALRMLLNLQSRTDFLAFSAGDTRQWDFQHADLLDKNCFSCNTVCLVRASIITSLAWKRDKWLTFP